MCLRCLLELWETHSALYIFYSLDRIFFQHRNLLSTPNSLLSLALSRRASLRDGIYFCSAIDVKGMCGRFHCIAELKKHHNFVKTYRPVKSERCRFSFLN